MAWLSGEHKTTAELAKAFGIPRRGTISEWARKYNWHKYNRRLEEEAERRRREELIDQRVVALRDYASLWEQLVLRVGELIGGASAKELISAIP